MEFLINDYVYHKELGIGRIIQKETNGYKVSFSNTTKLIAFSFPMTLISKESIENINTYNMFNYGYAAAWTRASNIYITKKFLKMTVDEKGTFNFIVKGTSDYLVVIDTKKNRFKCNCPVDGFCKHIAASMLYLKEAVDLKAYPISFKSDEIKSNCTTISPALELLINKYFNNGDASFLLRLVDYLAKVDVNVLYGVFNNILDQSIDYNYLEMLFIALLYNDSTHNNTVAFINNYKQKNTTSTYLKLALTTTTRPFVRGFEGEPLKCLVQKRYKDFFYFITDNYRAIDKKKITEVIPEIDFTDCKDEAKEYVKKYNFVAPLFKDHLTYSKDEIISAIDKNECLPVSLDTISTLDYDHLLKAINLGYFNNDNTLDFFKLYHKEYLKDEVKYVKLISEAWFISSSKVKKELLTYLRLAPDTEYVEKVLLNDGFERQPIFKKKEYVNPLVFFKYFTPSFDVKTYNRKISVSFNIELVDHADFYINVEENNTNSNAYFDTDNFKIIVDYLFDYFKDDIKKKYDLALDKINKEIEKENISIMNAIIDNACNEIPLSNYSESHKATLKINIDYDGDYFNIKLKIGNDKFYVVKNLDNFVSDFINGNYKHYGKNFSFTHKISNLKAPYDALIEYFIEISHLDDNYYYYGNSHNNYDDYCLTITPYNVPKIFDILKGEEITLNEKNYILALEPVKGHPQIDEDYHLKTGFDQNSELITFGNKTFVLSNDIINKLEVTDREQKLYDLIYRFNNRSIKPVLERFKNEIYYRFSASLDVSDSIKEDFKIERIECSLYFDYNEKLLSVEDKYYIDDKEILKEDIKLEKDVLVYNQIQNTLADLGFVNNECSNDGKILEFFNLDFENLKSLAKVYLSESIQNKLIVKFTEPVLRIEYESNMFNAFYEESAFSDEELYQIYKALKRKKKFISLNGNRIIDLEDSTSFAEVIDDFNINPLNMQEPVNLPVYKALEAQALVENINIDSHVGNIISMIKNYKNNISVLPNVSADLRPYQLQGYNWLKILADNNLAGVLADDMGLGKTLQIIAVISTHNALKPSLIACPKSLIFNWIQEFRKFAPDIKVKEIYGSLVERRSIIENINENERVIYITSYDSLSRDLEYYNQEFEFFIIDEAQAIKNSQTNKSRSVKQIKSKIRFALTGTPIENSVLDLYSIFDFLMPKYFDSVDVFKRRFTQEEAYQQKIIKKITPFILRRTKKDVLKDLPEKFETIYTVDMKKEQRMVYDSFCQKAKELLNAGESAFSMLPMLTRLRQICVEPSMFLETDYVSAKMEALFDILEEKKEHKILIFSSFVKALNVLENYFNEKKISYYMITGDTDAKERLKLCENFNNNNVKIFLISLKAGGFGLNLTGADVVIHLDPWWNLSAENQASDRAHRIGQKRNVEVIKLVTSNSIEQRVIELQNMKKDVFDKLIASDDQRITSLTLEDLNYILK